MSQEDQFDNSEEINLIDLNSENPYGNVELREGSTDEENAQLIAHQTVQPNSSEILDERNESNERKVDAWLVSAGCNENLICFTRLYGVTFYDEDGNKIKGIWLQGGEPGDIKPIIIGKKSNVEVDFNIVNMENFIIEGGISFNNTHDFCKDLENLYNDMELNGRGNKQASKSLLAPVMFHSKGYIPKRGSCLRKKDTSRVPYKSKILQNHRLAFNYYINYIKIFT
ncbi:uncharacterized protein KGF55_002712 [Candida pseudojiufengensis]|uniref:uncharacterized protein n=1 Tax=Candida pseudojiufengensis TaxID=497109 RepID=UPI0022254BF5|nr:uncharacterized protein KGF55_002712 [Candida pseudojiufengensis]KAI5962920.1 hypothetical protein KGF55_002712 [Candida pseudojiufengensis]